MNFYEHLNFDFTETLKGLSEDEIEKFNKLDSIVQSLFEDFTLSKADVRIPDKFTVLRFLQADKYRVNVAFSRLKKFLEYRQKYKVDELVKCPPSTFQKYQSVRVRKVVGRTKTGQPIIIEKLSEWINFGNWNALSFDEWIKCHICPMEIETSSLTDASKVESKLVKRNIYIGDCKNISYLKGIQVASFLSKVTKRVDEPHYPELSSKIILVNAPSFVIKLWHLAKQVMNETTLEKFQIFSCVPTEYLDKEIGRENLPVEYGGSNESVTLPSTIDYRTLNTTG